MEGINVSQLAGQLGLTSADLLECIESLGMPQQAEDELLSMAQARDLIAVVRNRDSKAGPGALAATPRKITLKRRHTDTLKPTKGGRAVRVETRRQRTYARKEPLASQPADRKATAEAEASAKQAHSLESQARAEAERIQKDEHYRRELLEKDRLAEEQRRIETEAVAEAMRREEEERLVRLRQEKEAEEARKEAEKAQRLAEQQAEQAKAAELAAARPTRDRAGVRKQKDKHDKQERQDRSQKRKDLRESGWGTEETPRHQISLRGGARRTRARTTLAPTAQGGEFSKPVQAMIREVEIGDTINVGELARGMSVKASELIKTLMGMGVMATINQVLDRDTATLVVEEMGHKVKHVSPVSMEDRLEASLQVDGKEVPRSPVVTVMGHVDHGKTSLLDYIRKTKVVDVEAGGITQHIGAYRVSTHAGDITFLDTPGHAAFTAMRARGANVTDIVVLVCAADDGVMPQTQEAVQHAKAAGVPLVVAVNKMDVNGADPDRVRNELGALDVTPEEWGGDTQFVNVSAVTGKGIDDLLNAISLQAELMELKAVVEAPARGVVVESRLERGRGTVATLLIQNGTLKQGDVVIAGECYGKVRALIEDSGERVNSVAPSYPVEMLGLNGTPNAGDSFSVASDDRQARQIAADRAHNLQQKQIQQQQAARLESMFASFQTNEKRVLKMVVKADVRGSLEAIVQGCNEIGTEEVAVNILGSGVGAITESDVNMALTYGAAIFGFNVRTDNAAKSLVEQHHLEVRYYNVIYELLDDVRAILEDMLIPEVREEVLGTAEVRDVFRSPRFGQVAGCLVLNGIVSRNKKIRVLRDSTVIFEGELESLRRFKDDVIEVRNGLECGIGVRNYNDVRAGDLIEVFESREIARAL